jgi:hypothetical protein
MSLGSLISPAAAGALYGASVALMLVLLAAPTAVRAQTTYIGLDDPRGTFSNSLAARACFLAALSSSGTDNIESSANGTADPTLTFGATGITAGTLAATGAAAPEPSALALLTSLALPLAGLGNPPPPSAPGITAGKSRPERTRNGPWKRLQGPFMHVIDLPVLSGVIVNKKDT